MNYEISREDENLDFFYNWIKEKDSILCTILTGSRVSQDSEIESII